MKILKLIFTMLVVLASKFVSAHALWIETAAFGTKGKAQEVKIYYGEYSHGMIEPLEQWYSDVKEFKLYLISPNQEKIEVKTQANSDHFSSSFTPKEDGTYTLLIEHPAKEAYKTTAFEFSTIAKIQVGKKSETKPNLFLSVEIDPKKFTVGETVQAEIKRDGKPYAEAEVEVVSADGWVKTIKTDGQGRLSFKAPVRGKYILEVTDTEEKDKDWFGTKIEKIWRSNTAVLFVN